MRSILRPTPTSYLLGAVLSLVVGGLALLAFGANPFTAWQSLFRGAAGSSTAIGNTLTTAAPVALAGLAVVLPLKARLLNVGGDGQFLAGALGCAAAATVVPHIAILGAILLLLAGAAAGGAWASIPAVGRAKLGVNEVVATILLNFAAISLVSWAVNGPLREKTGIFPETDAIPATFLLPKVGANLQLHIGVFVAGAVIAVTAFILAKTVTGYRLRVVGSGADVARYLGVPQARFAIGSLTVGGALAGLAGSMQILGVQGRLIEGFDPGYGFDGLAAAFLGGGGPIGTAIAACVLGGLRAGASELQLTTQLPDASVVVLEAILIIVTLLTRYGVAVTWARRATPAAATA